jgi:hypothetical protein
MSDTKISEWCRDRLFVRLARVAIIPDRTIHLTRYGWNPRPKVKLPPVTHGCSLTVPDLTGMRAIRAGMLLACLNAHAEMVA